MQRQIIYPGQIPLDTDLLRAQKNTMIGLAKLSAAMLGTATIVNGLACTPNSPAALNVLIAPGEIYALDNIDGTAYGSLAADTTHSILKQGILFDQQTISCPAPATVGYSINYLIQATFSDADSVPITLPYYNASNPAVAYSGPANSGTPQNTVRNGTLTVAAKAGVAATTGTQTTPSADTGYVGLYVVTVAYGASTITSGNIVAANNAPFLGNSVLHQAQYSPVPVGAARNLKASIFTASASITFTADEVVVKSALGGYPILIPSLNATLNTAVTGANGQDTGAAPVSGFEAVYVIYNPTTNTAALLGVNATSAIAPEIYGGANMPSGYTMSALVSVWPTNASGQFEVGYQKGRAITFPYIHVLNSGAAQPSFTPLSIAGAVPLNAKSITGQIHVSTNTTTDIAQASIAADANTSGAQEVLGVTAANGNFTLLLATNQTIYYQSSATGGTVFLFIIYIMGYSI
ncbi:MAG: hypothetical protein KGI54_13685 [Pseudomonadota bacterium]|nr:hypothetical protein [Pseudomonadota bacterium]